MNEEIEEGTLTAGRLLFWCAVGLAIWVGIFKLVGMAL